MAVITPETYDNLKPIFLGAVNTRTEPEDSPSEMLRAIDIHLAEAGYNQTDAGDLRPYVELFLEEVARGTIEPFPNGPYLTGFKPEPDPTFTSYQKDLFAQKPDATQPAERSLIDQLITSTKLYDSSEAVQELFVFISKLREFAPFNAMLLHIQKPGLTHAASAKDWWQRFKRVPKVGARPLLILRTKGPVDFVFDILDTEGQDLPEDAFSFPALGNLSSDKLKDILHLVSRQRIELVPLDSGDGMLAGSDSW